MDMAAAAASPAAFREQLIIPSVHGPRRFADVMGDFQRERFAAIDTALLAIRAGTKPPIGRYWWEATKGASKDSDLAVCLLWLLAFTPRPLTCQVGAADADQADEMRKAMLAIVRLNPALGELVTIQALSIVAKHTGSVCSIIPADVAGSHGARPDVLIINELSHIQKQEFAENLLDNAAKVPHGLVCIATNAGFVPSWQWTLREEIRQSPRWHFSAYARPAPWLDQAEIADAAKRNSANRQARLWWGQWVSQVGNGIPTDDIDAAIKPRLKPAKRPRYGWRYIAGVDLATAHDMSAVVVLAKQVGGQYIVEKPATGPRPTHAISIARDLGLMPELPPDEEVVCRVKTTNRLRLAYCRMWKAAPGSKQKLSRIEAALKSLHERFTLDAVGIDPYEATLLSERLSDEGLPMIPVPFSGKNLVGMAAAVLEEFANRNVQLYDCDEHSRQLVADLRRMQVVEMSYGPKLAAKRSGGSHIDVGTAFNIAVLVSRDINEPAGETYCEGDLVYS